MSVRMRHTRSHTKNRRSHHALSEPRLSRCKKCDHMHERHKMCENCGTYKGREVIDVAARVARKEERRKEKMKSLGKEPGGKRIDEEEVTAPQEEEAKDEHKPLSAEELSRRTR